MNPVDSRTEEYGGGEVFKGEFEYGYDPKSRISETKTTFTVNASEEMQLDARVSENALEATDDFVISKSSWNALDKDPMELSKPPVSARFSHRKVVKTTSEGGKTLRVSKPKRHDMMESTWKTITDGRPMPLTRHLMRKSWETHGGHHHPNDGDDLEDDKNNKMMMMMTKSETTTFNDSRRINSLSSGSSGKLRKDPSLSEEELNKRVEAFIMRI